MYSQEFGFRPNESGLKYTKQRDEYIKKLKERQHNQNINNNNTNKSHMPVKTPTKTHSNENNILNNLFKSITLEDAVLVALIIFLLTDNSENDTLLILILTYLLLF